VKGVLKRLLAGRRPALRDAARELRLGVRTLQRRLAGERATFQRLMEEARNGVPVGVRPSHAGTTADSA